MYNNIVYHLYTVRIPEAKMISTNLIHDQYCDKNFLCILAYSAALLLTSSHLERFFPSFPPCPSLSLKLTQQIPRWHQMAYHVSAKFQAVSPHNLSKMKGIDVLWYYTDVGVPGVLKCHEGVFYII